MLKKEKYKNILKSIFSYEIFDGTASLTFYLLFAIFPIFFLILQLSSALYISNFGFFSYIYKNLPAEINSVIKEIIDQVSSYRVNESWSLFIFFVSIWSVLNAIIAIIRQFNKIYDLENNLSPFSLRLKSLKILVYFITLVFIPYTTIQILNFLSLYAQNIPWILNLENLMFTFIKNIAMFLAPFLFSSILYKKALNKEIKLKNTLLGAGASTLIIVLATNVFGYYLSSITDYSLLYGGLGTAMLLITWLYIISYALLVGCIVNNSHYENYD